MPQLLTRTETTATPRQEQDRRVRRRVRPINVNNGLLLVRVVIGGLFVGHGCQKLFAWFGVPGLQGWTESLARNGLEPAWLWASMTICPAGPTKLIKPIFSQERNASAKLKPGWYSRVSSAVLNRQWSDNSRPPLAGGGACAAIFFQTKVRYLFDEGRGRIRWSTMVQKTR